VLAVQTGDLRADAATLWARSDRPAQLVVEWSTAERFPATTRVEGPMVGPDTDRAGTVELVGLPQGATVHYRAYFVDGTTRSAPFAGRLRTPNRSGAVWFAWSGDTCGQGWGINPEWGGLRGYAAVHKLAPDFFLHSGDQIYADNPMRPEVRTPDGRIWRNRITPAKSKVAETLDEFRGQFAYNLLDENLRALAAEVPIVAQWDDHEVRNNWYPGQILADPRYQETKVDVLAERARRAFREWNPIRPDLPIHRRLYLGRRLELFVLDCRSFRAPNGGNREAQPGPATAQLGPDQLEWLISGILSSPATWKIIACDLPIGLVVPDGDTFEAFGNGDGPPLGREHELALLLRRLHERGEKNILFLTADVHYAAAHHYRPQAARFGPFFDFWELVAGPLHAGCFGPQPLDPTFGPEVAFWKAVPPDRQNAAPWDGFQSFGTIRIDGRSGELVAALRGIDGTVWWETAIQPRG
jgi:alkaline phosphatase D